MSSDVLEYLCLLLPINVLQPQTCSSIPFVLVSVIVHLCMEVVMYPCVQFYGIVSGHSWHIESMCAPLHPLHVCCCTHISVSTDTCVLWCASKYVCIALILHQNYKVQVYHGLERASSWTTQGMKEIHGVGTLRLLFEGSWGKNTLCYRQLGNICHSTCEVTDSKRYFRVCSLVAFP